MPEILNLLKKKAANSNDELINKTYIPGNMTVSPFEREVCVEKEGDSTVMLEFFHKHLASVPVSDRRRFRMRITEDEQGTVYREDFDGKISQVKSADIHFIASVAYPIIINGKKLE